MLTVNNKEQTMNELIRKLSEQAQDWADAHAPYASEEHEYFAEKFAQLIIKECVNSVTCNEALNILDRFGIDSENFGVES
jgi:hypothetical protein